MRDREIASGKIDNGNELFGNHAISNTAYGYTDKKATNGYEALKAYDLNGDNVIDEKDEIFNKFKIWKDTNSNGITDEGELSSLADNNIKSIDINYKEITIDENSNTVKQGSKAALIDELIYEWAGVSEAAKDSRGIYSCLSKVDIEFVKTTKSKMRRGLRFYNIHCRQIASLAKFTRNDERSRKNGRIKFGKF